MNCKIRPMERGDKDAISHILQHTPEFLPFEVVTAEELIDAYLLGNESSGYHVQVAEIEGKVVGYICYGPTPVTQGTWDIYWMAVAPELQGKGIGRALIFATEKNIKANNGRLVIIETAGKPEYEKTRLFHSHMGYAEIARVPDYYAPGDDKLILQKRL